jgi:8-oxo-dGTP pyrophosphatase MutT (NUDIX family)
MKKASDKNFELLKILDKNGDWTGKYDTRINVHKKKYYYNSVSLIVFNKKNKTVLLEQRSFKKDHNPGKWALIGGHVVEDETLEDAIINEAMEEIGLNITNFKIKKLITLKPMFGSYSFNHCFIIYTWEKLKKFTLQKEEVETVEWIKYNDWRKAMKNDNKKYAGRWKRYKKLFFILDKK